MSDGKVSRRMNGRITVKAMVRGSRKVSRTSMRDRSHHARRSHLVARTRAAVHVRIAARNELTTGLLVDQLEIDVLERGSADLQALELATVLGVELGDQGGREVVTRSTGAPPSSHRMIATASARSPSCFGGASATTRP
jgi:hypothetical protein